MWNKQSRLCLFLTISSGLCVAQKVPVSMTAPTYVNKDQTALRFSNSLADEIKLSGKFYLWSPRPATALPPDGVVITIRAIPVKSDSGQELGSALYVEASQPSRKTPEYFKEVSEQLMWIPKDAPVGDESRSFLASVATALEH